MSHEAPDFEVSVLRRAGTAVVHVAGELDIATVPVLADVLHGLESPCDRVVLDLSELTFIDSAGMTLAVTEYQRAMGDGFEFALAGAAGPVLRVLRLVGLDVTLPMAPTLAAAVGDAVSNGDRSGLG
jgi:anti-sigma B factor antagonist